VENQVDSVVLYDLLNASSKGFVVFNVEDEGNGAGENLNCIFANNAASVLTGFDALYGLNYQTVFNSSPEDWVKQLEPSQKKFWFPHSGHSCLVEKAALKDKHLLLTITEAAPEGPVVQQDLKRKLWEDAEEIMQFGGWIWDIGQPKMQWTQGMYRLLGYRREDFPEENVNIDFYKKHVHPLDQALFSAQIARIASYTDSYILEFRIVAGDGVEKFVYLRGENVTDAVTGRLISVGTVFNVSMLKLIQSELEQKVSDLNKSNADLEQFAYIASHDLQEPLRKIVSFGERLDNKAREALNDEQHLYLDRILNATRRMQEMINNLLEFSRVSSASRIYVTTDLNEVMKSTLSDLEVTIQQKGAVIDLGELPVIEVIPAQISQLFLNLLSNSLKFTRTDVAPVIRISSSALSPVEIAKHKLSDNEEYIKIVFSDNGIGFDNNSAAKIFTIFQRLRGRSEYEGAGIGLAVCKKVVERHHGIIDAFGVPDEGATFEIILPRIQN
jgi:signal transduction histidine kinase